MSDTPGLPAPPPPGASALPAGTYDGDTVLVTGAGTGLGKAYGTKIDLRFTRRESVCFSSASPMRDMGECVLST